jgi:hypothetical protein
MTGLAGIVTYGAAAFAPIGLLMLVPSAEAAAMSMRGVRQMGGEARQSVGGLSGVDRAKGTAKQGATMAVSAGVSSAVAGATRGGGGGAVAAEPEAQGVVPSAAVAHLGLCQPGAVAVLAMVPRVCHQAIKVRAVAAMPPWSVVPTATHPRRRGHQEAGRDPGPAGRRSRRRRTGALPPVTALHHQQAARVTGGRPRTDQPPSRRNPRRGVVRRRQAQVRQPTIRHLPAAQGRTRPLTRPIERQEIHDER